jgi:tRNA(Arg) A34 adenosine deaminase TadA
LPISIEQAWGDLPAGARAAVEQQWAALKAGGLRCGAAIVDGRGRIVAVGRNHAYDPAGNLASRLEHPLQHTRLAHAELNALALVPTEVDPAGLTLWTTQHPCAMCAAALNFIGIGKVHFVADDPSDTSTAQAIAATRGHVVYEALGSHVWWTACNLMFLYNSAKTQGAEARNLKKNCDRHPLLVDLVLRVAHDDRVRELQERGHSLLEVLAPHWAGIVEVAFERSGAGT